MSKTGRTGTRMVCLVLALLFLMAMPAVFAADTSGSSSQTSRFASCVGGDINKLTDSQAKSCLRFKDSFEKYRQSSGLADLGVDLLFLIMTARGESGCRSQAAGDSKAAGGGILEAIRYCSSNPSKNKCLTTDDEISYGVSILAREAKNIAAKSDLKGKEALWMTWYAYNRGGGAANAAMNKMKNEGKNIVDGIQESCFAVYGRKLGNDVCYAHIVKSYHCAGSSWDSICDEGKTCQQWSGCYLRESEVKIHYVDTRWPMYVKLCEQIGGKIVDEGVPITPSATATTAAGTTAAVGAGAGTGAYRPDHPYFSVPYSVNPSFSTTIPYDFAMYDDLPKHVKKLERCKDDLDCVIKNLTLMEQAYQQYDWMVKYAGNVISKDMNGNYELPKWEAYCEKSDQNAVNSLAEAIDACVSSQDDECVCKYNLPVVPPGDVDKWYGRVFSSITSVISPVLGILSFAATEMSESSTWTERVIGLVESGGSLRIFMRTPGKADVQTVKGARFEEVDSSIRGDNKNELKYSIKDTNKILDIYKDKDGNLTLYPEGSAPSKTKCELHSKLVKFCVAKNQTFFAYDSKTNRMGLHQLVLKFAYLFKSKVSDVQNFEVYSAKLSSGRALLMWDEVKGIEASYYTLYRSKKPGAYTNIVDSDPSKLDSEALEDMEVLQLPIMDRQAINIITGVSLHNPYCTFSDSDCQRTYVLDTTTGSDSAAVLSDWKLYYSPIDKKYFIFVSGLEDDKKYFYGLTVTDTSGEQSPSFTTPSSQEDSKDDIPPHFVKMTATLSGDEIIFAASQLNENIDGSPLKGSVDKARVFCFEDGIVEMDLSKSKGYLTAAKGLSQGDMQFSRYISDFTAADCGISTSSAGKQLRFAAVGVRTLTGKDIEYKSTAPQEFLALNLVPITLSQQQ